MAYPPGTLRTLASVVGDFTADARKRHEAHRGGRARGPVTGFPILDRELGGALEPGLHVLHAGPGVGKTALAFQIGQQCGCPALYVSAEMRPVELMRRLTARHSRQYLGSLKSGERTPEEIARLAEKAAAAVPLLSIVDATRQGATIADLESYVTLAKGQHESGFVLLVIDSLHSWADGAFQAAKEAERTDAAPTWSPSKDPTEYELLNWAIAALLKLSIRLDCPIIAIAERSRASADDSGMSAAASSRKFEYSAETVAGLKAKKKREPIKPVWLTLAKNRHGEGYAETFLLFEGRLQEYRELSENEAESVKAQWIEEEEAERKAKGGKR